MRSDDQRRRPVWVEQGDDIYGHTLTTTEFDAELEDRPYRPLTLLPGGRSSSSRCHVNSTALDRTVGAQHRTRPAATPEPSSPAAGPNFPDAA